MQQINLKSKLFFLAILLCTLFGLGAKANAATYYVDEGANGCSTPTDTDYNPTTQSCGGGTAFVASSIANLFSAKDTGPNDIVEVRAATSGGSKTYTENVTFATWQWGGNDYGDATGYMTLKVRAGDNVTLSGRFSIESNPYIKIEGFRVIDPNSASPCSYSIDDYGFSIYSDNTWLFNNYTSRWGRGGVRIMTGADNVIVEEHISYRDGMTGITVGGGDNVHVFNCEISEIKTLSDGYCATDANGITLTGDADNGIYENNYIHDMAVNVTDLPHLDGFQLIGTSENIVNNNIFRYNKIILPSDIVDANATAWCWMLNYTDGLQMYGNICRAYGGVNAGLNKYNANLSLYNNTFVGHEDLCSDNGLTIGSGCWPTAVSLNGVTGVNTIKNNIMVNWDYRAINLTSTTAAMDYNLTFITDGGDSSAVVCSGTASADCKNTHDLFDTNPQFIDFFGGNYHLASSSPAIDAGITIASVISDYDGNSRPQGLAYDIGAYEYLAADTTPPSVPTGLSVN